MPQRYGNRWEIIRTLRPGGQAETFLVRDLHGSADAQYVLKRLRKLDRLNRFAQEVAELTGTYHPNVVPLVDSDLDAEQPYYVMPYYSAGDLHTSVKAAPDEWTRERAIQTFIEVCRGVAAAHERGTTHRDIKPDNILLAGPDGPAVVADFGLCFVEDGERVTLTMEQVGARFYMPPELADGRAEDVSPRSDVYSLGKLLYFLLSKGRIFDREQHRQPRYDLVRLLNDPAMEHANRALDHLIVQAPQHRYPDATAVIEEAEVLGRMFAGRYNVVSGQLPQRCTYCGQGDYLIMPGDVTTSWAGSGLHNLASPPDARVLVCHTCGHMQTFLLNFAQRRDWWGPRPPDSA